MPLAVASTTARVNATTAAATSAAFSPAAQTVIVAIVHANSPTTGTVTCTISNNGAALSWVSGTLANYATVTRPGGTFIFVAPCPTARTGLTVTATTSGNNVSPDTFTSIKTWVVTGADLADPIGGVNRGGSATNNLTTTGFATEGAASLGFFGGTDWNAAGAVTSADLTGDGFVNTDILVGFSGYKTLGAAGSSATANFDSAGTAASAWTWAGVEIRALNDPPDVGAGADATIDQYDTFSRTATESGGGGVTARSWTVISGPNQVGATLGTAAALSWAPTVGGVYVLRYSATNPSGTDTDDVTVTVNALVFPVSGTLRLTANATGGTKSVAVARSAPLVLTATRAGAKGVAQSVAATPLRLTATMVGLRINAVTANLRLGASLTNAGSSNGAFVTATMRLFASTSAQSSTRSGAPVTASPLRLAASATGTGHRARSAAGNLRLVAVLSAAAKSVQVTRTANVRLAAAIASVLHNGIASRTGTIRLAATVSGRSTTRSGHTVNAPLRLMGTSTPTSSVHFGVSGVNAPLRLAAFAFVQRIEVEARAIRARADTTVKYEVVAVARIPQVSGPPLFLEVDPIDWTGITLQEALNTTPGCSVDLKINKLPESVVHRMNNPDEMPTELWVNRNGKRVFAGPLLTGRVGTDTLSLEAQGIETYLRWMFIQADMAFNGMDQFAIAKALIDQWQVSEYGHFGIDTSQTGTSGVARTISYSYLEQHWVWDRIVDLTKMADGFDFTIDPASRLLEMYHPARGVDRSSGEDAIVFDDRNVTNADIAFSVAPGDIASDGLGTATPSGAEAPLVSVFANPELRSKFGRTGVMGSFQVADQGSLDTGVQAMVEARRQVLLIPGPNARVTLDADLASYDVGDTISYQAHSRLAATGNWRIRKRTTRVSGTGTESVSLEFV